MYRNAVASVGGGEVSLDVGFDVLSGGCAFYFEQIEHEFRDGIGVG